MHATSVHIRQALRALLMRPAYSLIIITTLAVGIGANAAVFGLANWLMFRPVPAVHEPHRLVTVRLAHPAGGIMTMSHPEMQAMLDHTPALSAMAGAMDAELHAATDTGAAARVEGEIVSANYFDVLGLQPARGAFFSAAHPGVVVSHDYWMTALGAAANIPGATMFVNGHRVPVLAVAPKGFTGATRSATVSLWVPSTLRTVVFPGYRTDPLANMNSGIYISMVGRLANGASIEQARHGLAAAQTAVANVHPRAQRYKVARYAIDEGLSAPAYERERLGRAFSLLLGMGALLLLLTCANVGNVMLAGGTTRRAEVATRQALGASRSQIVAGVLTESALLSLAGGAVALGLAALVNAFMRGTIVLPFLPELGAIAVDARVFAFAFAVSAASAIAAGVLPALTATRIDLIGTLKGSGRSVTSGGLRARRALTIAQVAVSLTLLVGGFLLARSMRERQAINPGFDLAPLMTFSVEPGYHTDDLARRRSFYADVMTRVTAVPGVRSAALGWSRPFGLMADDGMVGAVNGAAASEVPAETFTVGPRYLETMGMPLVAGREFEQSDRPQANQPASTVMLSASLARRLFGSADAAIGRLVQQGFEGSPPLQVIGVAGDARLRRAFEPAPDAIYKPFHTAPSWATVHVKFDGPAEPIAGALREAVRQADPAMPVFDMMTAREAIARQMSEDILIGRLTLAFALIATLLAAVGLYGVLAQAVAERRVEMGIRAALGAGPGRVLRLITGDALRMTATGAIAGVGLSLWLTRYLESRLYGIERFDVLTFAAAILVIVLTSLAAAVIPASRASRVDPVIALRR